MTEKVDIGVLRVVITMNVRKYLLPVRDLVSMGPQRSECITCKGYVEEVLECGNLWW